MAMLHKYPAEILVTVHTTSVDCEECPYGRIYCYHTEVLGGESFDPKNNTVCPNFNSAGSSEIGPVVVFCTREVTDV